MSDYLIVVGVFLFLSIAAFFPIKKSLSTYGNFNSKQVILLSGLLPISIYAPVAFIKSIGVYFLLLYLISAPLAVLFMSKIINVFNFSLKQLVSLYFQLIGKLLVTYFLIAVILKIILKIIKPLYLKQW